MLEIREALDTDPGQVEMSMTDRERQSTYIEFGWSAKAEMGLCFSMSDLAFTVLSDSKPVLMFGVYTSETDERYGKLWFIGSRSAYTDNAKEFASKSYRFLPTLADHHKYLGSIVDTRDAKLLRWLRFLGFSQTAVYPEDHQAEYIIEF